MTCEGCARAVTRAINRRAPTASVSIDVASGQVTVTGEAPSAAVVDAVTEAGFTVEGIAGSGG
jgi:copper chaperone